VQLDRWGVRLAALAAALVGIVNLISAVQPALPGRLVVLAPLIPLELRFGSRMTSALAGFALLALAGALGRRKRAAWIAAVILLALSALTHLVKGLDIEEASLSLALLGLLLWRRASFHAASDRPSVQQGLKVLALAFAFTLAYGALGFYLLDRHFQVRFGLLDALRQTVVMFAAFYDPGLEPLTGFGRYFAASIYVIGLLTLTFALVMLVRPVLVRDPATPAARARAAALVSRYGDRATARAALFPDKSYFFGPGDVVTPYAVRGAGALVLGDPIGPPEAIPAAVAAFAAFCERRDWTPAVINVFPDHLDAYRQAGYEVVCTGYEAIVSLADFTLAGSQSKPLRNAVTRMERLGYRAEVHLPPHPAELLRALRQVSDAWLTLRHGVEMGFSEGWFDEDYLQEAPLMVVHAPEGQPTAFVNVVSEYQRNERTIDLMRHDPEVANGTMEFLFARLLLWAKEQGVATFSLGVSAVVGVGERPTDPRPEQLLHAIAEAASPFYNFAGLHRFKEKFGPTWEPRYLAYRGAAHLPLALTTLIRVHGGAKLARR
jgi:phosphatidylglycerol lysyltransferase